MDGKEARAERINIALNGKPIAWLADKVGVALSTAHSYVKGTVPPADVALRIAEVLDVDIAWYIRGDTVKPTQSSSLVDVPLLDQSMKIVGSFGFPRQLLEGLYADVTKIRCIILKGSAMRPSLPEGAEVLIAPQAGEPDDGEIYLLRVGSRVIVRRLMQGVGGVWYAVCDNPAFRLEDKEQIDVRSIVGKAVWVSHRA